MLLRAWMVVMGLVACTKTAPQAPPTPAASTTAPRAAPVATQSAATAAPTAPAAPLGPAVRRAPTGNVTELAMVSGWAMLPIADRVVVLDDGMRSLTALDAQSGKRAWTTTTQTTVAGLHSLHALPPQRLVEWAGGRRYVLDAITGKVLSKQSAPHNGSSSEKCQLTIADGVCANSCECELQVYDCMTGTPIGPEYRKAERSTQDFDGADWSGCFGFGDTLLGRAGSTALVTTEDVSGTPKGPITAGVDVRTRVEVWRLPFALRTWETSSHSVDERTCWFGDGDEPLRVHDCASGNELWTTARGVPKDRHEVVEVAGRGLFELRGRSATLYEMRTGAKIWQTTLPPATLAWPRGLVFAPSWSDNVSNIEILDPATGRSTVRVPVKTDDVWMLDRRGGFVLVGPKQLVAYNSAGLERARARIGQSGIGVTESLIAVHYQTETALLAHDTLRELGRFPTSKGMTIVIEEALGVNRIATFEYDGKVIGTARLFAVRR